jgi:hypothetical protein
VNELTIKNHKTLKEISILNKWEGCTTLSNIDLKDYKIQMLKITQEKKGDMNKKEEKKERKKEKSMEREI